MNKAYTWLCHQRKAYHSNSDIWDFRYHYKQRQSQLIKSLANGRFRFDPMMQLRLKKGTIHLWSSKDAFVLKMLSITLFKYCSAKQEISMKACHIKNNGGIKQAVNTIKEKADHYPFVFKSDIKGFYENLQHDQLMTTLNTIIKDQRILDLIEQSIRRTVTFGGLYWDIKKGIPRGSSLSPLLGALALRDLDIAMSSIKGIHYSRYMDDWVVLCPTRAKLRKVIKITHKVLNILKLSLHPDKTFIGKTSKGFDFLGYFIQAGDGGLRVSRPTLNQAIAKLLQLYEQGKPLEACRRYWHPNPENIDDDGM